MTDDTSKCVIIDSGTSSCKIGLGNEDYPRLNEPFIYSSVDSKLQEGNLIYINNGYISDIN